MLWSFKGGVLKASGVRVRVVGPPSAQDCAVLLVTARVEAARSFLPCVAAGLEPLATFTLNKYFYTSEVAGNLLYQWRRNILLNAKLHVLL